MTDASTKKTRLFGRDRFALRKSPLFGVGVVLLFTAGIVLLPGEKLGKLFMGEGGANARNLGNAIFRLAGFVLLTLLALDLGFRIHGFSGRTRGFLLSLPFLAVAVNNAPIIGLADGSVWVHATASNYAWFGLYCVSVGLLEETVFRGIILPLLLRVFPPTRKGAFWAVISSSALFGALHLINLLSSDPLSVLAQVGYSFLIGAMCAVVMLLCRNVFACAFLHAVYNFGGTVAAEFGNGQIWGAATVALTVTVGVAAAAYGVFALLKKVRLAEVRAMHESPRDEQSTCA